MRGARGLWPSFLPRMGIIPADAGSTLEGAAQFLPAQDHPRGCGEHHDDWSPEVATLGSSPRMRGAPQTA